MYEIKEVIGWSECKALNEVCLPENYTDKVWEWFFNLGGFAFIAYDGHIPIGYICCSSIYNAKELHIVSIGVIHQHRRKGIATRLLERAMEKNELAVINLDVIHTNNSAIKLYEKVGFVFMGIRAKMYHGKDDGFRYESRNRKFHTK